WNHWLRSELAPTHARKIRTAIMVAGAALCVIISMTLQVPQLATSAYMVFFISKESKLLTTITGVGGVIVLTIGIGATLLLYKFTYGHPELRIPGMAIALFLGMWLSRILVMGPLGFLLGFVVAVSQSVGEEVPSPELLVRGLLWLWVALAYAIAVTVALNLLFLPDTPQTARNRKGPSRTGVVYWWPTRLPIPRTCISPSKSLSPRRSATSFMRRSIGRASTRRSLPARSSRWRALRQRSIKERYESSVASSAERSRFSPSYSSCRTWKRSHRSSSSSLVPRPSRAGLRPEANGS